MRAGGLGLVGAGKQSLYRNRLGMRQARSDQRGCRAVCNNRKEVYGLGHARARGADALFKQAVAIRAQIRFLAAPL